MNYNEEFNDINLVEIFQTIWRNKISIIIIVLLSAILSVGYALSLPNIYISKAILAPTDIDNSLESKLKSYAGFMDLPGASKSKSIPRSTEGLERLKSFEFFSKHIVPNIKLEDIFAIKEWNPIENKIIYNESIFNSSNSLWVRQVSFPLKTKPSNQELYAYFYENLSINEDSKTSFITISIEHISPYIAKEWVEIMINKINLSMSMADQLVAKEYIEFLNESYNNTKVQSIKEVISGLQEEQMKKLMLASSNDEYVFKIIDPPIVPEIKSSPNRALICIAGTTIGVIFSLCFIFLMRLFKDIKK